MVRTFPQQCNDIFPDKESAARHEEDECPMNIFGPKQRAQIKAEDSELKECKVVLSRVDDFSNPPKVDESIVKQEVDDDDEEHELRIDEEEEDDDLDDIDDDLDHVRSMLMAKKNNGIEVQVINFFVVVSHFCV